ncbi:3-isopropylmalate dehydratase small subunit [Thermoproteota archaeon]
MSMRAWKFGDDINTDIITPGRYTVTTDKTELGKIAFIEHRPEFIKKIQRGDIVVAGKNFGCGSSREHSPIALKAAGVGVVIAKSFARIFFRNAINIGLPILICKDTDLIQDGDSLNVNLDTGEIYNHTQNVTLQANPLPKFIQTIIEMGGLLPFIENDGYV